MFNMDSKDMNNYCKQKQNKQNKTKNKNNSFFHFPHLGAMSSFVSCARVP